MILLRFGVIGLLVLGLYWNGAGKEKYDPSTLVFPPYLHTYGIRKATRFHLFLFSKNRTQFNDTQGLAVVRLKAWEDPTTENDDDEVTVYGVNSGEDNIIYNKSMKSLGIYGLDESGEQRLSRPHGIAANARGEVYVADTGNHRIVRLFNSGRELQYVAAIGREGQAEGEFRAPFGVALDVHGQLYVTDTANNRIQVFNSKNEYVRKIGNHAGLHSQFIQPTDIEILHQDEEWVFHKTSFLVVIDSMNQRIQKLALSGKTLLKKNMKRCGFPDADLQYIDIDYYGNIYITDKANHCIHKFDHFLNLLTSYGRLGSGHKEFVEPRGITIYRRFGQIFIGEAMGAQYYWIGVDVFRFKLEYAAQRNLIKARFFLTEPAYVTVDVYDLSGVWVTRSYQRRFMRSGLQEDVWEAKIYAVQPDSSEQINNGNKSAYANLKFIPQGTYKIKYKFEPTYSSYHYFSKIFEKEIQLINPK